MNAEMYDDAKLARLAAAWMTDDVAGTASEAHLDQIITATGRVRPLPRWLALLKEPPMRIQTHTRLVAGLPIRRPVIVFAVVALLMLALAAGLLLYIGSMPKLPPLTGPARNGLVVTGGQFQGPAGIFLVDPATGAQTTLVEGDDLCCAAFSPDGRRIDYLRGPGVRTVPGLESEAVDPTGWIFADLDGSTIAEVPARDLVGLNYLELSPRSDRALMTTAAGASFVSPATGNVEKIDVPFAVERASFIGATGDILLTRTSEPSSSGENFHDFRVYRLAAGSTGEPTQIAVLHDTVFPPVVSPDGTKVMYLTWGPEARLAGRIHVMDLASGVDTAVTPDDDASNAVQHNVEDPHWSPDSSRFAAMWYFDGYDQLGITDVRTSETVFVGPKLPAGSYTGHRMQFSPDGASLLVYVQIDLISPYPRHQTWRIPIVGQQLRCADPVAPQAGERPDVGVCEGIVPGWGVSEEWGWQRLAP
jgi:hypothetical protein